MVPIAHLREALQIKQEIDERKARLAELKTEIIDANLIKKGKKSGTLKVEDIKVKISKSEKILYDTETLDKFRAIIGNNLFFDLFEYHYSPKDSRELAAFLKIKEKQTDDEQAQEAAELLREARTVKPNSPSVVWSKVEA